MELERIEDTGLAQYSYIIACPAAGECAVVDPRRDVDVYLDLAAQRSWDIRYVLETHIHADFASGARELAARSGAELLLSSHETETGGVVSFDHRQFGDGEDLTFGAVRLRALHTPGHTPEHLSFLIYDLSRSETHPMAFLTGDFLFVGSLGRPDLLGETVQAELAAELYESAHERISRLPDSLEIMPGHGAGSMCGSGMSGRPISTLGYERATNPYLEPGLQKGEFIEKILGSAPPFPGYYRRMKKLNAEGPAMLADKQPLRKLAPEEFKKMLDSHVAIDLRGQLAYCGGHIPGVLGLGLANPLSMWAGWVAPYDTPLVLVAENPSDVEPAVRRLARVGLDSVVGYLAGGMSSWLGSGYPVASTPQISAKTLKEELDSGTGIKVLDVREADEVAGGTIPGALNIPAGRLSEEQGRVAADVTLRILCGGGYRSVVAASVLERAGRDGHAIVAGGLDAWRSAGYPVASP